MRQRISIQLKTKIFLCPNIEPCKQEYLEIDLQGQHVISSVVVQGRYGNGLGQEYAEYFVMMYWREDTRTWVEYREGDNRLLLANNNTYQPVETRLRGNTILTSKVRWEPKYFLSSNIMNGTDTGCFYKGQGGPEFYLNCFHLLLTEKVRLMDYAG